MESSPKVLLVIQYSCMDHIHSNALAVSHCLNGVKQMEAHE